MHATGSSTPLLVDAVCRQDMRAVIQILANSTPEIVNGTVAPRDMRTPLHLACAMGHLALGMSNFSLYFYWKLIYFVWSNADTITQLFCKKKFKLMFQIKSCFFFALGITC
jgi:hypothetical protein